jgi:hypothetical protein
VLRPTSKVTSLFAAKSALVYHDTYATARGDCDLQSQTKLLNYSPNTQSDFLVGESQRTFLLPERVVLTFP